MSDAKGQVTSSAAEVYDEFFVPALFQEWAEPMASAMGVGPGQSALDVACGTGVVARELARRLGPDRVCALDRNDGMLAVARAAAPAIQWEHGRAESLPYEDALFDAVACQFGLMFFDDRAAALREMWRVLRPGGRLVVAVWAPLADTPGYAAMYGLLSRLFGDDIACELEAPFCLGDPVALRAEFARAGIAGVEIQTRVGRARFPSIAAWLHTDVRGWTLADKIDDDQFALLSREAPSALQAFVVDDGVAFDSPAHIAVARKPA